ncbi:MAG TPA: alkaline phosphatase family protein [Opitutus sp.]|nr:alkaline phosphatase family protein [Opitutus sp.]
MSTRSRKVLLVGWDSADWKVINPLLDAGKLPHLEQLVNGGVIGNLATLYPILSPMLWTSIGTGKRPFKHGIHGFAEPDPHTGGVRPITNLSRQTKAVWNILSQSGKKCVVIGWWPSHPAEPLPEGVTVSNHYQRAPHHDPAQPWPMPPGTVHPARLAETLAELRVHPGELDGSHILPFVPKAAEIDQLKDRRLEGLAKTIADCTTIHAAATHLIATEPWDFFAVYYDAIDHFGHGFMKYHPPRQAWVPEKDFELYQGVIEAGYRYHDMMLGVLMAMAGPDTTVLLMSDHGFHPDNLRPSAIPMEPAGPAVEHRHYGIFAMRGPDLKKDERIYGATVLDITPTLLTLFGLPVGRDMDGKPLVNIFAEAPEIETVESWDAIAGNDGSHPPGAKLDAGDAQEAIKQLEALGYISPLPEDAAKAVEETQQELDYNLACAFTDANRHVEAAALFAKLWAARPDEHRYGAKLLSCQLALGRFKVARATLEQLRANRKKYAAEAAAELKRKRDEWKDRKPEDLKPPEQTLLRRLASKARVSPAPLRQMEATLLQAEGKHAEAIEVLQELEKRARRKKRGAASGETDDATAAAPPEVEAESSPLADDPGFHLLLGQSYVALKRWDDAERVLQRALELDPDNAQAFLGLARVGLGLRRNFEAASDALTSVGLLYHNPAAHHLLGVALHRIGRVPHAVDALKVCLAQNPNFFPAHRRLVHIYERRLKQPEKAQEHREIIRAVMARRRKQMAARREEGEGPGDAPAERSADATEQSAPGTVRSTLEVAVPLDPARTDAAFVTVVSGLPRSGTSLMMQMLAAGGLPPLHDGHRPADADNPRGYFEFAAAKNLRADGSWLPQAEGRAVKLVAQLLPFLPAVVAVEAASRPDGLAAGGESGRKAPPTGPRKLDYRVIWMERSLDEVLASQKAMLDRHGRAGAALAPEKLRGIFEQQLAHVAEIIERRQLAVLRIAHANAVRDPAGTAARVAAFLGLPLDRAAMAACIDPALHRQHVSRMT